MKVVGLSLKGVLLFILGGEIGTISHSTEEPTPWETGRTATFPMQLTMWQVAAWKVEHAYMWAICELSNQSGRRTDALRAAHDSLKQKFKMKKAREMNVTCGSNAAQNR